MRNISFFRHAAVYALGDFFVLAAGFLLLPLYSRCLSLAEFGVLEVVERTAEIFGICLMTRSIPMVSFTYYKQNSDAHDRSCAIGAGFVLLLINILIGALSLILFANPLSLLLQLDRPVILVMAIFATLVDGITVFVQAMSQARFESGYFVAISFTQFLSKVLLCLLFVAIFNWGIWGIIFAGLLRSTLVSFVLLWREFHRGILLPDLQLLYSMISFALPLLPTGLCFFVLNSGDRFFLMRAGGQDAVGIYGLGYRLAMLVALFSTTPIYRVWSSHLHDVAVVSNAPIVIGRAATRILAAYTFLGLLMCLFQNEIVCIFAGNTFASAAYIVSPLILAYWFHGASVLMESVFYVRRRTCWKLWIAIPSTIIMLALYAILIPNYGSIGAAFATLAGFFFHAGITCLAAQSVFFVRYEFGRLAIILALAIMLWYLGVETDIFGVWSSFVKFGLWLLWPITLWMTGIVTQFEKQLVFELITLSVRRLSWSKFYNYCCFICVNR